MKRRIELFSGMIIGAFVYDIYAADKISGVFARDLLIIVCGVGLVAYLLMLNRLMEFRKKMHIALQHIMENNFHTGISIVGEDEFGTLAAKFNAALERINTFDVLREGMVDRQNRLLNIITRNISEGVMIMDIQTQQIKLNKAAQEIFEISQDELSIESVVRLESNHEFNEIYRQIIERRINTAALDIDFFLPILRAKAALSMKIFAVKDKDEQLNAVICIFLKQARNG